ncbi:MAG: YifB family Mg chelatase-like AAA ATPase [Spirochaetales bacterium]|nr:YifB family Mg chelatase-like AAA ATPase [Spirochaetales bacterium]
MTDWEKKASPSDRRVTMIYCYAFRGYEGDLISVEVDVRRGIPSLDVVGLPDSAVKEARERVRIALKRGGYEMPLERVLINLSPAGVRKEGARYDLSMALAILRAGGKLADPEEPVLVLGELQLDGRVRPVRGVISAVSEASLRGVRRFIVPRENLPEALSAAKGIVLGLDSLSRIDSVWEGLLKGKGESNGEEQRTILNPYPDLADLKGQSICRRVLEISAAGRHNLLLFGPPGCGKTMAARRLPGLLPPLVKEESLEVTRLWSQAGCLEEGAGLIEWPPFRMPHHSASLQGMVGGSSAVAPGEISLAHRGILFLDETPEFHTPILQGLREPVENGTVRISRAGKSYWFPADFQLVMAANPCPCGNLGREASLCICTAKEIERYWRRIGGALMDRVDIRIPLKPVGGEYLLNRTEEGSRLVRERVLCAWKIQEHRHRGEDFLWNSRISVNRLGTYCALDSRAREAYIKGIRTLNLSSRASHSVLRVARTVADLDVCEKIGEEHVLEALQYRRYGDRDIFWRKL